MLNGSSRQRVKNGAKWLDKVVPGWEKRIDIETLELNSARACI